jgi:hypothetical protein
MKKEFCPSSSFSSTRCLDKPASRVMRFGMFVLAGVFVFATVNASALAFSYDEAIDGDLPSNSTSSPVYPLGIGANTFSGTHRFAYTSLPGDDFFDSFAFSVPAGGTLVSITADTSLQPSGSGVFSSTDYWLQDAAFATIDSANIPIPSTGLSLFASSLPLPAGQYAMRDISHNGGLVFDEVRLADYTFTLTVVVPEPSALVLGALGLAAVGLAAVGRCRRP